MIVDWDLARKSKTDFSKHKNTLTSVTSMFFSKRLTYFTARLTCKSRKLFHKMRCLHVPASCCGRNVCCRGPHSKTKCDTDAEGSLWGLEPRTPVRHKDRPTRCGGGNTSPCLWLSAGSVGLTSAVTERAQENVGVFRKGQKSLSTVESPDALAVKQMKEQEHFDQYVKAIKLFPRDKPEASSRCWSGGWNSRRDSQAKSSQRRLCWALPFGSDVSGEIVCSPSFQCQSREAMQGGL